MSNKKPENVVALRPEKRERYMALTLDAVERFVAEEVAEEPLALRDCAVRLTGRDVAVLFAKLKGRGLEELKRKLGQAWLDGEPVAQGKVQL